MKLQRNQTPLLREDHCYLVSFWTSFMLMWWWWSFFYFSINFMIEQSPFFPNGSSVSGQSPGICHIYIYIYNHCYGPAPSFGVQRVSQHSRQSTRKKDCAHTKMRKTVVRTLRWFGTPLSMGGLEIGIGPCAIFSFGNQIHLSEGIWYMVKGL